MSTSERSTADKCSDQKYNATCIHCGATDNIQLWPHRNGNGDMVGILFACEGCHDVARGVWFEIHGIRGHSGDEATNGEGNQ